MKSPIINLKMSVGIKVTKANRLTKSSVITMSSVEVFKLFSQGNPWLCFLICEMVPNSGSLKISISVSIWKYTEQKPLLPPNTSPSAEVAEKGHRHRLAKPGYLLCHSLYEASNSWSKSVIARTWTAGTRQHLKR